MTARSRRIVLSAAVLPLVVLVGLRSAWAGYACGMDGEVRKACCCPEKPRADRPTADQAPVLAKRDCCDLSIGAIATAPEAREPVQSNDGSIALRVAAPALPIAHAARTPSRIERARPPPRRIPTFLANRAILR